MKKRLSCTTYIAVSMIFFSGVSRMPVVEAEQDPTPTATPTPTLTSSPTPTGDSLSGSGFKDPSPTATPSPTPSPTPTGYSLSRSGFKDSRKDSLFGDVGDTSMGDQGSENIQNAYKNLLGSFGSALAAAGPDGFQMPRRCSTGPKDRSQFQGELQKDQALRTKLTKLCVKEVGSQGTEAQVAVFETLFNRAQAEGNSIKTAIHNGYYEPINKGTVDGVSTETAAFRQCQTSLQTALGGTNTIGCRRHAATTPADALKFGGIRNSILPIGGETFYSKPGEKCDENFC